MDYCNSFKEIFSKDETQAFLKTALEIKKADRSTSKKLKILSVVSCIGMTVLGYAALGPIGAILFLIISYVATFSLTLSMKKKALLAYLKHYREKLPMCLENAEKINKPETPDALNLLYPDTLHHWTVCYKSGSAAGFVRIYKGASEIANGFAVCSDGKGCAGKIFKGYFPTLAEDYTDECITHGFVPDGAQDFAKVLEENFESFSMLFSESTSLLFLPTASDFMAGRVEDEDDVNPKALSRQWAYLNIAKVFNTLDANELREICRLFSADFTQEEVIYNTLKGKN